MTNPRFTGGYAGFAWLSHQQAMLAKKPDMAVDVDSAWVPVVAVTAWQGAMRTGTLRLAARASLIHGAAGNVGAFAVLLAHRAGLASTQ